VLLGDRRGIYPVPEREQIASLRRVRRHERQHEPIEAVVMPQRQQDAIARDNERLVALRFARQFERDCVTG